MNSAHPPMPTVAARFGREALALDCAAETDRIKRFMIDMLTRSLSRRGLVVGVSGGIDSAVCATLATRALGRERVFGLLMPERDGTDSATERGRNLCETLGIRYAVEDISPALEAMGCYRRRDAAIRTLFPDYGEQWRNKIVLARSDGDGLPYFQLVVEDPDGQRSTKRMPLEVYLQVVAATNFKQRIRKNLEYYHGERLNYAVVGTPNRLEYELGFFVRGGDGLADLKPIAHLYKSQVYALAAHLGVPEEIQRQTPSTDTYSLPQTQEEFYFGQSYEVTDLLLYADAHRVPAEAVAALLGVSPPEVEAAWRGFVGKRKMAQRTLRDAYVIDDKNAELELRAPGKPS